LRETTEIMVPQKAAGEDLSMRLRRLKYRAGHRGTRELDLLLSPFANSEIEAMTDGELDGFERLLDEEETSLQAWFLGQETPPNHVDKNLLRRILAFRMKSK
jgi:antitoxin CptB